MKRNIFLISIFALILIIPTFDSLFNFSPVKELFEKRLPTEKPELPTNFIELKKYPRKFENFFNDNYGFRKSLISINSKMMDNIFDESPDARVVIGKDGWLYFDNYDSVLDATGKALLDDELINRGVEAFAKNWQKMRQNNIDYLLVIAADKTTIYPEFLPDYIKVSAPGTHRIDKFVKVLKKKYPDFPLLDLRDVLLKAKKKEIIYHKTDTHWNSRGAHYGYVEIMKILAKNNSSLYPRLRKDFEEKEDTYLRGDISEIMNSDAKNVNYDLKPKFARAAYRVKISKKDQERFYKPTFFTQNSQHLPRLFVYQDSFFNSLFWLVSEHFSDSFYINEFPCDLSYKTIKSFRPNIVIQQFWEGRIETVLKECS